MLKNYAVRWTTRPDPDITCYDDYTDEHRSHITIVNDALYRHAKLNIKYTAYDMQEEEDIIYPKNHSGIMALSSDNDNPHPYIYARVLDLFHVEVTNNASNAIRYASSKAVRLEMVWVQWYDYDEQIPSGFNHLRYPSITLCPDSNPASYGLLHPEDILRYAHLIPDSNLGLAPDDYRRVQVNMWVGIHSPMTRPMY